MIGVDRVNTMSSQLVLVGWFVGLAYYGWWLGAAVPWWGWVALAVPGMFAVSLVVGAGLALLAGAVTRVATGSATGSPHAFSWAALAAPVLAFLAAGWAVSLFA